MNEHYDVAPMKSLMRILGWQTGTFDMDPPDDSRQFPERIEMSTEGILMEAMRQIDEIRRLGSDMPPLRASVIVFRDGKAVYDGSHNFIYVNEVADALSA